MIKFIMMNNRVAGLCSYKNKTG